MLTIGIIDLLRLLSCTDIVTECTKSEKNILEPVGHLEFMTLGRDIKREDLKIFGRACHMMEFKTEARLLL